MHYKFNAVLTERFNNWRSIRVSCLSTEICCKHSLYRTVVCNKFFFCIFNSNLNELVFDNDSKILERVFLYSEYLYKSYFPPIQFFFGENNNIVYADSSVNILNESTSPKFEKFYTKKDSVYREN